MAENKKIIIKTSENFSNQDYKIQPLLLDNPLFTSLLSAEKIDSNRIVGIFYNDEKKTISEINNQTSFNTINGYRNPTITYSNILSPSDSLLESLPNHPYIVELIENMERMETEYPEKFNMLNYLKINLFDTSYAVNMWMVGRNTSITPVDGKIYSDEIRNISGYIKVENAPINMTLNYILRGIPLPMRRTLTSVNGSLYNYIFTYPQYLLNNIDLIQAVQYIECNNYDGSTIYYGDEYYFKLDDFFGFSSNLANLHIINKVARNLESDE